MIKTNRVFGAFGRRALAAVAILALTLSVLASSTPLLAAPVIDSIDAIGPVPGTPFLEEIVTGPDGNIWFTDLDNNTAGYITDDENHDIVTFTPPTANSGPAGLTVGPDGMLYFTQTNANQIARVTTGGVFEEFPIPGPAANAVSWSIITGPDDRLWFTTEDGIWAMDTDGNFNFYGDPAITGGTSAGLSVGSDGAIWFTVMGNNGTPAIARTTTTGDITVYPTTPGGVPFYNTLGPDGNIWYTISDFPNSQLGEAPPSYSGIGYITPDGDITEFPLSSDMDPGNITTGPDGTIWFTNYAANGFSTIAPDGEVTFYELPNPDDHPDPRPFHLHVTPDGRLFVAQKNDDAGYIFAVTFEEDCAVDFSDNPDSYGTTLGSDGARHCVVDHDPDTNTAPLMLGTTVDTEGDGFPSVGADGDDLNNTDDEDGVPDPITITPGEPTAVTVTVTNNTDEDATLAGWIDLNGNGAFEPTERATFTIPANSGTSTYTLSFPATDLTSSTYARFRVFPGNVTDPQPTGFASNGEVEDYRVENSQLAATGQGLTALVIGAITLIIVGGAGLAIGRLSFRGQTYKMR